MKNKTVLVTGGFGFIGSHTVIELLKLGTNVIVYDNLSTGKILNLGKYSIQVKKYIRDISHIPSLLTAMKNVDYVIHLAAMANVKESFNNPCKLFKVNIEGTNNVLTCARTCNVKKVVLASSSAVKFMSSPYAYSKKINELQSQYYTSFYNLPTICLRYYNVYGSNQTPSVDGAVVTNFIHKMINNEAPIIYGNGEQKRDFVNVKDVARANILALQSQYGIYDVGHGFTDSILNLYKYIKTILNINKNPIFKDFRKGDIAYSVSNSDKGRILMKSKKGSSSKRSGSGKSSSSKSSMSKSYRTAYKKAFSKSISSKKK